MFHKLANMFSRTSSRTQERDAIQAKKVKDSQHALLAAATATADAAQDVTGMLRDRLDDSLRQLDITSKLLSDSLIVCSSSGVIETVNPAVSNMFDWAGTELIGKSIDMLFAEPENGASMTLDDLIYSFNSEKMSSDSYVNHSSEYIYGKKKNGQLFWIDGDVKIINRLDGSIKILFLVRDVSAKVSLFKTLEQNEQMYRSMFDQSFDVILVVQNNYIVAANNAVSRVMHYDSLSMIAQPLIKYIHADFVDRVSCTGVIDTGHFSNINIKVLSKHGEEIDVFWICTPLQWEGNNASLITFRDMSEYKRQ